ncbi:hypothetical protein SAMN05421760_10341 [Neptunomonas antarctica]|uniref:Uncharacterized protein n=2 Tax=Neptunomonas antarctica TaxID=619304 RepID=A0A1N7KWW2_9GAMM|nr:hypothetical protein SAMN05421760_10341 [Neptunomonas antarctica]
MYRRNLKDYRVKTFFKFASLKMDSVMTVESALAFDSCFNFEYSPDVIYFDALPIFIRRINTWRTAVTFLSQY